MKLNFWPFNRPKPIPFAEAVQSEPMPPCGDKETHYYWERIGGMPCPSCAAKAKKQREREAEDRMAQKIAAHVVAAMKGQP